MAPYLQQGANRKFRVEMIVFPTNVAAVIGYLVAKKSPPKQKKLSQ